MAAVALAGGGVVLGPLGAPSRGFHITRIFGGSAAPLAPAEGAPGGVANGGGA
jgi:hypothetical protein